jgi:hypothetical protein
LLQGPSKIPTSSISRRTYGGICSYSLPVRRQKCFILRISPVSVISTRTTLPDL